MNQKLMIDMNKEKHAFKEVWPVMLTPFTVENKVDYDALRQLTEFYIATGSTGIFANCLSSEMFQLSDEERIQVTKTVVDQVKSRQKVVATGNFSVDTKESIEFIKRIYDTGIDEVIINSALLGDSSDSDDLVKGNMEAILQGTGDISFGIYECPVPYKRIISVELMQWMADTGRFGFLKSTSCDLDEIQTKLAAVKGSRVKINNANIPTALGSLKAGAHGIASIASNFYPELVAALANFEAYGDKILKIQSWLCVADTLIHQYYPMSAKYFLGKRNVRIQPNTRIVSGSFTCQDYIKFDELLKGFEYLASEVGIPLCQD